MTKELNKAIMDRSRIRILKYKTIYLYFIGDFTVIN